MKSIFQFSLSYFHDPMIIEDPPSEIHFFPNIATDFLNFDLQ